MRMLKLAALGVLLVASLGLMACTDTDMSGTAGDPAPVPPGQGVEPAPGDVIVPPADKDDPGGASNVGGAGNVRGGAQVEQTTDQFLAGLPNTQRVDFAYVAARCHGCDDVEALRDYVEAACDVGASDCTDTVNTLLTKKRSATQIRNDQGLVGLPTAPELLNIYRDFKSGVDPVGAAPGDQEGDDDADEGTEVDEGGDVKIQPALPDAPAASAQAILTALDAVVADSVSWADVTAVASRADAEAVAGYFEEAADAETTVPGCADCLHKIKELLAGGEITKAEMIDLLTAVATQG